MFRYKDMNEVIGIMAKTDNSQETNSLAVVQCYSGCDSSMCSLLSKSVVTFREDF